MEDTDDDKDLPRNMAPTNRSGVIELSDENDDDDDMEEDRDGGDSEEEVEEAEESAEAELSQSLS
jgi:hypothetical protein